jgi:hypothetical protein
MFQGASRCQASSSANLRATPTRCMNAARYHKRNPCHGPMSACRRRAADSSKQEKVHEAVVRTDSLFPGPEEGNQHAHVAGLSIYDPSTAPGGSCGSRASSEFFASRLGAAKLFRSRLVHVPFGSSTGPIGSRIQTSTSSTTSGTSPPRTRETGGSSASRWRGFTRVPDLTRPPGRPTSSRDWTTSRCAEG